MSSDNLNKSKSVEELAEERRKEILARFRPAEKTDDTQSAQNLIEPVNTIEQETVKEIVHEEPVIEQSAEVEPIAEEPAAEEFIAETHTRSETENNTTENSIDDTNIPVGNIIVQLAELNSEIDDMMDEAQNEKILEDTTINIIAEPVKSKPDETMEKENIEEKANLHNNEQDNSTPPIEAAIDDTPAETRLITDFDAHLFSNGTFYKVYEKFGAHITTENDVQGVRFTTWAPNANSISVIGEFNGWHEGSHEMAKVHDSGLWSVFIPNLKEGDTYKYSINSNVDGNYRRKIDPYAFRSEMRPKNASVVHDLSKYEWKDSEWVSNRKASSFKDKPMNIYELHLGSWRRDYDKTEFANEWGYLSYGQLAKEIVEYVIKMGYTHIELLPVMEHPLDISWGYQVTHYFAPTSRFGEPQDFMYFIDHCHENGIGVILDWVPAHFPADEHALAFYDGKQIYAYESWKKGFHKDWNTYVFDYSRPQVRNFLISSALFWLEKYHIDGLRVDAVASMLYLDYSREQGEWEPNIHGGRENLEAIEFLKHLNDIVHNYHPDTVMIAEESTAWPGVSHTVADGGLGFDMKWNMGWMNDILLYFSKEPVHRKFHQGKITFSLWYAFSENFVLPISHDEVVHGKKSLLEKMPGDTWQKFANLRLFLGFMTGHPGKKLNFMTTDIAQYNEWDSEQSLEWNLLELVEMNKKLNVFTEQLNHLYKSHTALYQVDFSPEGFHWIDFSDALNSVLSFYRTSKDKNEIVLFTFNMTPAIRRDYIVGVPEAGFWKEIFNSDAEIYGGSGVGNMGGKESEPVAAKNWENSIKVTLPPLAFNIYLLEHKQPKTQIAPGIDNVEDYYVDTDTEGGG